MPISDRDPRGQVGGMLRTALALSPAAVGVYAAAQGLRASQLPSNPFKSGQALSGLGHAIGVRARKGKVDYGARAQKIADVMRQGIETNDIVETLGKRLGDQNSLLQMLSAVVEDSSLGLDQAKVTELKNRLTSAMSETTPTEDSHELVRGIVQSVVDRGSDAAARFDRFADEYKGVGPQITVPDFTIAKSGVAVNQIDSQAIRNGTSSLSGDALELSRRVLGLFGDSNHRVEFYEHNEFGGQGGVTAQVWSANRNIHYANLPIVPEVDPGSGGHFFRTGANFNTLRVAPRGSVDASALDRVFKQEGVEPLRKAVAGLRRGYGHQVVAEAERFMKDGKLDYVGLNAMLGGHAPVAPRAASGVLKSNVQRAFGRHVRRQLATGSNHVTAFNLQYVKRDSLMHMAAAAATGEEMDPGRASSMLTGFGDETILKLGVQSNSAINQVTSTYTGTGRAQYPITARIEQVMNRPVAYFDPTGRGVRKFGGTHLGAGAPSLAWGEMVTGHENRLLALDFLGMQGMTGEGLAFTGVKRHIRSPENMVVLDPKEHGYGASDLLKRLNAAGDEGLTVERREFGGYFGQTPAGKLKRMVFEPNVERAHVALAEVAEAVGKHQVHASVLTESALDVSKDFSLLLKGNVENVGPARLSTFFRGGIEHDIERLAGTGAAAETIFAAPDMMKKGTGMMVHAIAMSAVGLSGDVKDGRSFINELNTAAQSITDNEVKSRLGLHSINPNTDVVSYKYALAASRKMHASGAKASDVGTMLAGVYNHLQPSVNTSDSGAALAGIRKGLDQVLDEMMSPAAAKEAKAAAARGFMLVPETFVHGPTVAEEYGRARAGVEARTAQNVFETLRGHGFTQGEAATAVSDIYSKKVGFTRHHEIAGHLSRLVGSITGTNSPLHEVSGQVMGYEEFRQSLVPERGGRISPLLERTEGGLRVNFQDAPAHVLAAVKQQFGSNEIELPGAELMRLTQGTEIKQSGAGSLHIGSAYAAVADSLAARLLGLKKASHKEAGESLAAWRGEAIDLFANVLGNVHRGKLRGSISGSALARDLTNLQGLKPNEAAAMLKLARRTNLGLVEVNAQGFMSSLLDRRSAVSGNKEEVKEAYKELANDAKMFFTQMEGDPNQFKGLYSIGGRDPQLSGSNAFVQQIGRTITETSRYGNVDVDFERMAATEEGQKLLAKTGFGEAKSFGEIARSGKTKATDKFFRGFMRKLEHFTHGEGGATMHYMRSLDSRGLDLGPGAGAFKDSDGDAAKMIMLPASARKRLNTLLGDATKGGNPERQASMLGSRTIVQEISEEISSGVKNLQTSGRYGEAPVGVNAVMEDALKEMGLTQTLGKVDVKLRGMHSALLDYATDSGEGLDTLHRSRNMLAAFQEKFGIKTKSLKRYTPAAEQLGNAFDRLMTTGDISDVRMVTKDMVFHGTEFANGGTLGGAPLTAHPDGHNAELIASLNANRKGFTLEETLAEFQRVADHAIKNSTNYKSTGDAWAARIKNEGTAEVAMRDLRAGKDQLSASLRGFVGETAENRLASVSDGVQQVRNAMRQADMSFAGPLALGLAGSAVLMSAVGDQGYAPEPLVMPGENVNKRVTDAIAGGSLFNGGSSAPIPSAPINMGTTYMQKPNPYQVRGETWADGGLSQVNAFMSRVTGGRVGGSIYINDARRPVSSAYSDRLMGEY